MSGQATVWDGQTLVLQQAIGTASSRAAKATPTDKILLVFVTPTEINAAGDAVRTAEEMAKRMQDGSPGQQR